MHSIRKITVMLFCLFAISVLFAGCAKKEVERQDIPKKEEVYQETDPVGKPITKDEKKKIIENPSTLEVTSPAFANGSRLPDRFSKDVETGGKNISVPVQWTNVPKDTKSFAILFVDTSKIAGNWIHWLVINIPGDTTSIPEGASGTAMPKDAIELNNSFQEYGYGGPKPPSGSGDHTYELRVYALADKGLELGQRTSYEEFLKAIDGRVTASGMTVGTFSK